PLAGSDLPRQTRTPAFVHVRDAQLGRTRGPGVRPHRRGESSGGFPAERLKNRRRDAPPLPPGRRRTRIRGIDRTRRLATVRTMRPFVCLVATTFAAVAAPVDDFVTAAKAEHGAFGEKAARFLAEHMPEKDRESLTAEFLGENLRLALKAREEFPWAKEVPEEIFLNDVLPYAVFDEPRDLWRAFFLEKAAPVVKEAKTASEAAQALNREIFNIVNVHYNTGRKRPNQSAK